jgi:hypothetical protein
MCARESARADRIEPEIPGPGASTQGMSDARRSTCRVRHRGYSALRLLAPSLLIVLAASCEGVAYGPSAPAADVAVVEVSGAPTVQVNEWALLTVVARDSRGGIISNPPRAVFSSTDATVLEVTDSGAVHGLRRGSAFVSVSIAGVSAVTRIRVRARLKIYPDYISQWNGYWPMGIGDTLRLSARYVDVNGNAVSDVPAATWRSDQPAVADVGSDGRVVAAAVGDANIYAGSEDDTTFVRMDVLDLASDQPATIRFAHALKGVGPITFLPNKGDAVTLSFGQSQERQISPGLFMLQTRGMPAGQPAFEEYKAYNGLIHGGDRVSIYAVGQPSQGLLTPAFGEAQDIPADSARVRLVQGSAFPVVYLRPTGAPATGVPEQCYFDPIDASEYYSLASGAFDVILGTKSYFVGGFAGVVRLAANAPAGRAVTLVLIGTSANDAELLTFIDQ